MIPHLAILRADHLGDMILTTPLARTLGKAGWRVTVLGKDAWAGVWKHNPYAAYASLDDLCPNFPSDKGKIASWLRRLEPTHVLVPYYCPPLLWASFFSLRPNRYAQFGRVLGRTTLHHCLRTGLLAQPRHMGEVWQDFAEAVGVARTSPQPEIFLAEEERKAAREKINRSLTEPLPLVVVHPFHGASSCHLPLEAYAEVVRMLLTSKRCNVIVTGLAHEKPAWETAAAGITSPRLWVACGELSLRELIAIVGEAKCVVCGSTGVLHIASALAVPSVSAMCPHPRVCPEMWRNLTPGSDNLMPSAERCPRFLEPHITDCGFRHGPGAEDVSRQALLVLGSDQ